MKRYNVDNLPEPEFWRTHDWVVYDDVEPLEARIRELETENQLLKNNIEKFTAISNDLRDLRSALNILKSIDRKKAEYARTEQTP